MNKIFLTTGLVIFLCTGCSTSNGSKDEPSHQEPKPAANDQSGDQTNNPSIPNDPSTPTTKLAATDIIIVNAIGSENPVLASQQKAAFKSLLSNIGKKYSGQDFKLALIASPTAAGSSVSVAINAADGFTTKNSMQLAFELAAKDAFMGTLVAGCSSASSNLDSTHVAGTITICGDSVPIPAHAWTWGVEDLKGRLDGFLRPGASRIYVIFTSSSVDIGSSKQFLDIAKKQNKGITPRVFAVAPSSTTSPCTAQNTRATALEEVASLSSGKVFSYCQTDWTSIATQIPKDM